MQGGCTACMHTFNLHIVLFCLTDRIVNHLMGYGAGKQDHQIRRTDFFLNPPFSFTITFALHP